MVTWAEGSWPSHIYRCNIPMTPNNVWYLSATFPENTGQKVKVDLSDKVANYILFDCYDILKYFVLRNPRTTKFVVYLVLPPTPPLGLW